VRLDLRVEGAQVRAVTASGVHGTNLPRDARCSGAGLRATLGSMYTPAEDRYETMPMRYCGRSGLQLPLVSLGRWQNFGDTTALETQRETVYHACDRGLTQTGLANNSGPRPGAAEANFGRMLRADLAAPRDELVITTKAGYLMPPGPSGDGSSRKYLLSSLDASLRRMGLDYVDIFYSHRFNPDTPLTETMGACKTSAHSGPAPSALHYS